MFSMQSTQQVVEDPLEELAFRAWCSSFAQLQGESCRTVSDDAVSDCSTVFGNQDGDAAQQNDDSLSECCSESVLEVETLFLFDWDDTLFPTSWMQQHGLFETGSTLSNEDVAKLGQMAERARLTLQTAIQIGKVVIVTNAVQGWVELCCKKFMPSLFSLLKMVDIISARSTYERSVEEPSEWKRLAFELEVGLFYESTRGGQQGNVVSVGDSLHELLALKSVTNGMPNCFGKSIKLLETPSIEQLIEQHEVLVASLRDAAEHSGDLDVEIGTESLE